MNYDIGDYSRDTQTNFKANRGALKTKTFKIRQSGNMIMLNPAEYGCDDSIAFVVVEGQGHVTHMGLTSVNISYCTFDGLNSNDIIYGFLTAANGDKIFSFLTFASEAPDENGIWIQEWTVYDGSGRFDGATGEITLYVTFDFPNSLWSNTGVGTITY